MTDEFNAYNEINKEMKHQIINHQEQYANGNKHTNINNYRDMGKVLISLYRKACKFLLDNVLSDMVYYSNRETW